MALTKARLLALTSVVLTPIAYTDKTTGEPAFVKRFTVAERAEFRKAVVKAPDDKADALGFTMIACDEKGNLLFTADDVEAVGKLPEAVVNDALTAFNKQTSDTVPTGENVEEAEKN